MSSKSIKKVLLISLISMILVPLSGFGMGEPSKKGDPTTSASNEIQIMSYNLENLFDTDHDPDKSDWEFLPKGYPGKYEACMKQNPRYQQRCLDSDWTRAKLQIKLDQIKKMVLSQGELPDILAVQEIENLNVLRMLADTLGYNGYILEEGPDRRGIDVALLYNENKITYINHQTKTLTGSEFENKPSRDILAVYFDFPKGKKAYNILAVYVNHWPSQAAPASKRFSTAGQLKKFMNQDRSRFGAHSYHSVVMGDFNTIDKDWPHPLRGVLENPKWSEHLLDAQALAKKFGYYNSTKPLGTYFYPPQMSWTFLDHIYLSQNLHDSKGMEASIKSFRVVNPKFATHTYNYTYAQSPLLGSTVTGVPIRSNHTTLKKGEAGYSDHFPVTIKLKYR